MANLEDHPLESIDPDRTALLVVDAQRGFTSNDASFARQGMDVSMAAEALPRLRSLIGTARDLDLPIAFTRTVRRADGRDAPGEVFDILPAAYQDYGEATLRAGTTDVEYSEGVEPRPDEYEVTKQFENAFHGTRLETHLRTEGVDTLLVCGFTSNVCVESTIRGAHERGFDVVVVEDCCASYAEARHESMCHNVEYIYGVTVLEADVPDLLGATRPTG
jgi:nicotinamidase-related amidase